MPAPLKFAIGLALLAFPILELAILIRVGRVLGLATVTLIVISSGVAGAAIVRRQGLQTFARAFSEIQAGRGGLEPMLDGLLRVTAGVLLILPGLITDLLGLALLVPFVRKLLIKAGLPKLLAGGAMDRGRYDRRSKTGRDGPVYNDPGADGVIIEGEYERIDEAKAAPAAKPKGPLRHG